MDIFQASEMVDKMVEGFEGEVVRCLSDHLEAAETAVREQMYSGLDGNDRTLNPTYDNDPYFEEPGMWYHRATAYKDWKSIITPPQGSTMLGLQPRNESAPNLYINGKFHSEVFATMDGDTLRVDVSPDGSGPDIVAKYGDNLLRLGPTAIGYFNNQFILPRVWKFFEECGYSTQ